MINGHILLKIFCDVDDFCKKYEDCFNQKLIEAKVKKRNRPKQLCVSEIITILIMYQYSYYKNFKYYYKNLEMYHKKDFPKLVSYNRFIEIEKNVLLIFYIYLISKMQASTAINFVDSTPIKICNNKRISTNKVFRDTAEIGKSTIGWFFGFKLHIVINTRGELIAFSITRGNVDDRVALLDSVKYIIGKLYADKGYISTKLHKKLIRIGIELITSIKKNMKNILMTMFDKVMLRKRSLVETVIGHLKYFFNIEHTRHRSFVNFFINIFGGLGAYILKNNKPSLKFYQKPICLKLN